MQKLKSQVHRRAKCKYCKYSLIYLVSFCFVFMQKSTCPFWNSCYTNCLLGNRHYHLSLLPFQPITSPPLWQHTLYLSTLEGVAIKFLPHTFLGNTPEIQPLPTFCLTFRSGHAVGKTYQNAELSCCLKGERGGGLCVSFTDILKSLRGSSSGWAILWVVRRFGEHNHYGIYSKGFSI